METEAKHAVHNAAYNTQPAGLEKKLDEIFYKKAPFQLPVGLTKWLADNSWWLVLVGAVLSVLGILSAYGTMNRIDQAGLYLDSYSYMGMSDTFNQSKNMLYVSMLSSAVSAVLLFMASSKLKAHLKSGWNLMYYSFLLNAAISLIGSLLFTPSTFVFSLIGFAIGFTIGAYILFQLRHYFAK
jgi:hypothetical protein